MSKLLANLLVPFSVVLLLALPACGGEEDGVEPDQNQSDSNQSNDEQPETFDPEELDRETVLSFIINSEATIPFYVQTSTFEDSEPAWLAVALEGDQLTLNPNCLPCLCDENACPECQEPIPRVEEIEPGGRAQYDWNGVYYDVVGQGVEQCTEVHTVDDAELEVGLCFGTEVDEDDYVVDPTCQQAGDTFNPADSNEVTITVD